MAYFYVDSTVGTRTTGGGTTKQTGSFSALGAANVYEKIIDAISDGASNDDIIVVSTDHNYSSTTSADFNYDPTNTSEPEAPLIIIGASSSACDSYASGGKETSTANLNDMLFSYALFILGVDFQGADQIRPGADTWVHFKDLTLTFSGSAGVLNTSGDGCHTVIEDCTVDCDYYSFEATVGNGALLEIINTAFIATTSGYVDNFTDGDMRDGGATIRIIGSDLSIFGHASNTCYLFRNVGGDNTYEERIDIYVKNCKLHSNLTGFHNEEFASPNKKILVVNSAASSSVAEYQYYYHTFGGYLEDNTTVYRNESTAFPLSSSKVSLKASLNSTTNEPSMAFPFKFEFPTRYIDLTSTSSDTIRIYLATSSSTLTDADVYAIARYTDDTNNHEMNHTNSIGSSVEPQNIFRTGTALDTDSSSTWTGSPTYKYYIDIDTSNGEATVPIIDVYITKPNVIIYFDTTIGVV